MHVANTHQDRVKRKGRRRRLALGRVFTHIVLFIALLAFLFPFYWMITSSLKPQADIFSMPIKFWPTRPTLDNYLELLGLIPSVVIDGLGGHTIARFILNSTIIAIVYTLGAIFLASLAGYAFAKIRFKGRNALFIFMLATMMIPASVGLIPNYIIIAKLGWVNTWLPLIIPSLATPFNVFWMRQYTTSVPDEMLEAAKIDGCGPFGIYWRVVLPVVKPGLAALAIFAFMSNWNAFMVPLIYLNKTELYTLPLFLGFLNSSSVSSRPVPFHLVFAGSFLSVLPILAIFVLAQRHFVAGLTAGSLK